MQPFSPSARTCQLLLCQTNSTFALLQHGFTVLQQDAACTICCIAPYPQQAVHSSTHQSASTHKAVLHPCCLLHNLLAVHWPIAAGAAHAAGSCLRYIYCACRWLPAAVHGCPAAAPSNQCCKTQHCITCKLLHCLLRDIYQGRD